MKKIVLNRLLAFALLFAAGAAFVFIVGTYRNLAVKTYPVQQTQVESACELAVFGDRAASTCGFDADSELYINGELDVDAVIGWLDECRPENLVLFLECTRRGVLDERLDEISLLLSQAVGRVGTVYVMAAPPPLEQECTSDFRPMYVRQNNRALRDLAERYGAVYIDAHTLALSVTEGTLAPEYCGDEYFSPEGAELVRNSILAKM